MRQICQCPGMVYIMALDKVSEQYCAKILLMDLDSQVLVKINDFWESPGFPIVFKSASN